MPADTLTDMPAEEMTADDLTTAVVELPFHHRVRAGVAKGENWLQLIRFGVVGASGFIVNTVTYALCLKVIGLDYKIALPIAYLAGVINNFTWNSRWTFTHKRDSHTAVQGMKFLVVSTIAFGVNYGLNVGLVHWTSLQKVPIEVISNILVTPVNFLGQKLWSFKK
ncbi:MAG TPA: GtrA family protein [Solirubrobacteraceae bacterium]|nr:GtrA family protein [Solirubrobacteraceae bacterium]